MADSKDKTGVVAFPGIKRAGKPDIAFGNADWTDGIAGGYRLCRE